MLNTRDVTLPDIIKPCCILLKWTVNIFKKVFVSRKPSKSYVLAYMSACKLILSDHKCTRIILYFIIFKNINVILKSIKYKSIRSILNRVL